MKGIITLWIVFVASATFGQRDFTPKTRKQAFGTRDFRDLRYTGLQVQLGPAYTLTHRESKNEAGDFLNGAGRGSYEIDPSGRLGGYIELGLAHFPKKRSKLSLALKTVLVSYYDWGIGFKYIGGTETTIIHAEDNLGNVIDSYSETGKYYNGFLYGRFSLHKNINFERAENFFLDNTLGVNADYNFPRADETSEYHTDYTDNYSQNPYTHNPLVIQLHYGLAAGFRLRRGTYLTVGARTPILGFHEWNKANPSLRWYSSNYWPVLFHVKFINLFQKRHKNGCPPVEVNDEDRKRNDEFMQGN